jgi:hypothetical protein
MFTVAPVPPYAHDVLAAPIGVPQFGAPGGTVLVLLVAAAVLLFHVFRAAVAALVALLVPALALLRVLVLVSALLLLVGMALVAVGRDATDTGEPAVTPSVTSHPGTPSPMPRPAPRRTR